MKYPRYPEYKDSGIEWIGKIPEYWSIVKLKNLCAISSDYGLNVKSDDYKNKGVRLIRITDIGNDGNLIDKVSCQI